MDTKRPLPSGSSSSSTANSSSSTADSLFTIEAPLPATELTATSPSDSDKLRTAIQNVVNANKSRADALTQVFRLSSELRRNVDNNVKWCMIETMEIFRSYVPEEVFNIMAESCPELKPDVSERNCVIFNAKRRKFEFISVDPRALPTTISLNRPKIKVVNQKKLACISPTSSLNQDKNENWKPSTSDSCGYKEAQKDDDLEKADENTNEVIEVNIIKQKLAQLDTKKDKVEQMDPQAERKITVKKVFLQKAGIYNKKAIYNDKKRKVKDNYGDDKNKDKDKYGDNKHKDENKDGQKDEYKGNSDDDDDDIQVVKEVEYSGSDLSSMPRVKFINKAQKEEKKQQEEHKVEDEVKGLRSFLFRPVVKANCVSSANDEKQPTLVNHVVRQYNRRCARGRARKLPIGDNGNFHENKDENRLVEGAPKFGIMEMQPTIQPVNILVRSVCKPERSVDKVQQSVEKPQKTVDKPLQPVEKTVFATTRKRRRRSVEMPKPTMVVLPKIGCFNLSNGDQDEVSTIDYFEEMEEEEEVEIDRYPDVPSSLKAIMNSIKSPEKVKK
ncbi:unnamed protein product [Bursaphelenchus okinawaensis]|uniref:Uncharacterized protein n=1 Tax=Bursaphelenchus okinawaensis TaxID=465554 RepID=A0A811L5Q1_9BILA|nr:unnamed protein product [Bursaphelenchus okinawaensis]CAG9117891.1 unnamed protein product [Bursaphelenchus okinawaensis]